MIAIGAGIAALTGAGAGIGIGLATSKGRGGALPASPTSGKITSALILGAPWQKLPLFTLGHRPDDHHHDGLIASIKGELHHLTFDWRQQDVM